jgi:tetratricopeptide (TPR) repeat protein
MLLQYVNNYKALDRLYRNGHYEDAVAGFKSSIASDEGNSYLMLGLARCYVKTGNDSLANVYFQRAIESDADNVQIYKWQAEFLKENRRYEEAERAFLNFINHAEVNDPDLAYINSLRTSVKGIALFNAGKKGEALDSLTKAIKYYESNSEAYCYISRYYAEDKRDYAEAEKYVNLAIVHDTNYVPAYVQKADLMTRKTALLGLPSTHSSAAANRLEAIRLLTKAISKDRRNNEAYFNRGKLYLELGGFDDLVAATEDFTKAADDTLNNKYRYWSIWYRGKCRYALGGEELRKAGDDFRKSAENYGLQRPFVSITVSCS